MNEEKTPLKISVTKNLGKVVLDWVRSNCPYVKGIPFAYQFLETGKSLSLHTMKGAVKRTQYVDGGYEGFYPFAIYYRNFADSTNSRLESAELLDLIGEWVNDQEIFPDIDNNKYITSISCVTNSVLVKRHEGGIEDYMITFELLFSQE